MAPTSLSTTQQEAIRAISKAPLVFNAGIYLVNNGEKESDTLGGGMFIEARSTFSILPNTTVYWENNHATWGGAIYVEDFSSCNSYVPKEDCFFQLPGQNLSSRIDVQLVFKNNSADDAGNVLYGGAIDSCTLTGTDSYRSGDVFDMIVHIKDDTDYNRTSVISTNPLSVCPCGNAYVHCSLAFPNVHNMYPGETVHVSQLGKEMEQFLVQ